MIASLAVATNFFFNLGLLPVEAIYGIALVLLFLYELAIYVYFKQIVGERASLDAKALALKYKEITEERKHYRNMRKTFNLMLKYKTSRSIRERNNSYLRAVNLLRLESLRFFSTEFTERSFREINARVQEIILLSSENLARIYSDTLTKESYLASREREVGRNFHIHTLFSSTVLFYLLVRIQTGGSEYSTRMHSRVAEDNLKEVVKLFRMNFGSDHKIWEDLVALVDSEEWKKEKIRKVLIFDDIKFSEVDQ